MADAIRDNLHEISGVCKDTGVFTSREFHDRCIFRLLCRFKGIIRLEIYGLAQNSDRFISQLYRRLILCVHTQRA
jgi:hypothetical protein